MSAVDRNDKSIARSAPGALDGRCIMRYAHVFRDRVGGGAEQYLNLLDGALLERHALTIVKMHLVADASDRHAVTAVGRGRLVWVPVPFRQVERSVGSILRRFGELVRYFDTDACGPTEKTRSVLASAFRNRFGHLRYAAMVLSDQLCRVLDQLDVELLVLHWISYDLPVLIQQAHRREIPVLLVNHFDNSRLDTPLARRVLEGVAGVGGVSAQNVPTALRDRFRRLSDAVDAEFFSPQPDFVGSGDELRPILLPSRITFGKGHHDLLKAAHRLRRNGVPVRLQFAGPVEEQACKLDLDATILALGLGSSVEFTGQVGQRRLRELYQGAAVIALPSTYEGLGRVLLEAQAMGKPVVAYATGGVPEALEDQNTGFLVEPGDVEGLADRLGRLLADEALRVSMGRNGRQFVLREFSPEALVNRHEAFYREALLNREHGVRSPGGDPHATFRT